MNARLTASANADHSESFSLNEPVYFEGKFYLRVMISVMPDDGIIAAEAQVDDGKVVKVEHPSIELWGDTPEATEEDPDPVATGGIINFPKAFTSEGDHEINVTLYFANGDTCEVNGFITPPALPIATEVRPEMSVLVRLGVNLVTLDVVERLLAGEAANTDEITEALIDIGKVSEGDQDLSDLRLLAALATGMRDGISAVTRARLMLHKAVNDG